MNPARMMNGRGWLSGAIAAAGLSLMGASAWAAGIHEHGAGQMNVALEGQVLTVELSLPLEVVVGFERPAKTAAEKARWSAAQAALQSAAQVVKVPADAQCQVQTAKAEWPNLTHEGHADVDGLYVWRCAQPAALNTLEISLFKTFKSLHRLDVQHIGPQAQGAARLTPKASTLRWSTVEAAR